MVQLSWSVHPQHSLSPVRLYAVKDSKKPPPPSFPVFLPATSLFPLVHKALPTPGSLLLLQCRTVVGTVLSSEE